MEEPAGTDAEASRATPTRRTVLDWLLGLSAAGALASVVYPIFKFVFPPPSPKGRSKGAVLAARRTGDNRPIVT